MDSTAGSLTFIRRTSLVLYAANLGHGESARLNRIRWVNRKSGDGSASRNRDPNLQPSRVIQ